MGRINVTGNGNHLTEINGKTEGYIDFINNLLLGYSEDEEVIITGLGYVNQNTIFLHRLDGERIGFFQINKVKQSQGTYSGLSRLSKAYLKDGNIYIFGYKGIDRYTINGNLVASYRHECSPNATFLHKGFFYYVDPNYIYKMSLFGRVVRQMKIDMVNAAHDHSFYINDEQEKIALHRGGEYVLCDLRKNETKKFKWNYGRGFTNLMWFEAEGLVASLGDSMGCNLYRITNTVLVGEKYVTFAFFSTSEDWPRGVAMGLFICYDTKDKQKRTDRFHRVVDLHNHNTEYLVLPSKKVLFVATGTFQSF